jgi:hypothetical protein
MRVTAGRSDVVDLYNGASGIWSTAQLSEGRNSPAATTISVGNLAIFAGGSGNCSFALCDVGFVLGLLCVFEAFRLLLVCAAGGYRLMRVAAGKDDSNAVDLYNSLTGRWSTAQLSVRRISLAATSVGNLAIFAGGFQYDSGNCCFAMCDGGFVLGLLCVLRQFACCLLVFALQEVTV